MHSEHKATLSALGANIRAARERAGLTLPTLAKLTGLSKGNLSKIEHGANVTAVTLYRIGWAIGLHPWHMLPPFSKPIPPCSRATEKQ